MRRAWLVFGCLLGLAACGDDNAANNEVVLDGERYAVLLGADRIEADTLAQTTPVDIPDPSIVPSWVGNQSRSSFAHVAIKGFDNQDSATIGDGRDYTSGLAPNVVASPNTIFAMDAAGNISAHSLKDIDERRWESSALVEKDSPSMIGGGLFLDEENNVLYAANGYGQLAAIDAANGTEKWRIRLGAPIRGAPSASNEVVVVLTADNQTIALRTSDGQTLWEHRGIRENAGFFSTVSPLIWQGTVLVAYSSGEVVAFSIETGSAIWTDTLITDNRTHAAAAFTGVNATPLVQDGVAYLVSASGTMVANALLNGRPLWEAEIGSTQAIWGAGNMLYVLTPQNDIVALLKHSGQVRWVADISTYNDDGFDITPNLLPPILLNGHIVVANVKGDLIRLDARTGARAETFDIADDIATPLISVNGVLISVHKSAQLRVAGQ